MAARIEAISPPYAPDVQNSFEQIMPEGMAPLTIFRTVANNPRVLQRMVAGGLLDTGSISINERELIILRTCAMLGAEYEWGVHVAGFAHKAGLNAKQIADTCQEKTDPLLWSGPQQLLLGLADELRLTGQISDTLWQRLTEHYRPDQVIELLMLTGLYHAVSFVVNATRIPNEGFAPRFPDLTGRPTFKRTENDRSAL